MSREGPNVGVRYGAPPPPSNEQLTIPTPDQVKAQIENGHEAEVVALIKTIIAAMQTGCKQYTTTTKNEDVARSVTKRLIAVGWTATYSSSFRDTGYFITVSF